MPPHIEKLDILYMRVCRKVAANFRGTPDAVSKLWVRQTLKVQSVDGRLRRRRLRYVASLATSAPAGLRALLQQIEPSDSNWQGQMVADVRHVFS